MLNKLKKGSLWKFLHLLISLMPVKFAFAIILLILIGFTEGISILLLVPLLNIVGLNVQQGNIGQLDAIIQSLFSFIGLKPTLIPVIFLYIVVISFAAFLYRQQSISGLKVQYEFESHLRKNLFSAISNADWLFFSRIPSSNLAHALTNEIERTGSGAYQLLTLITSIIIGAVYIFYALKLSGIFAGIILLVGITLILALKRKTYAANRSGENISISIKKLYSSIIQNLDGLKTIKSYGMEKQTLNSFSTQSNEVAEVHLQTVRDFADLKFLYSVGSVIILSFIVVVMIEVLSLPTAEIIFLLYLFISIIPRFSGIQSSYQYFINMLPSFDNIMELQTRLENAAEIKKDKSQDVQLNQKIHLNEISFSYGSKDDFYIHKLDLFIPAGKTTAIIGPSGSGKSTLADMLMGLIKPDEGQIFIDNHELTLENIESWKRQIGYVAQDTFLFNSSIRKNLIIANENATDDEIEDVLRHSAADFAFKTSDGLDTVVGDRGVRLSGGEKQRLSLARALLRKPSLLILDEATSNLDTDNEKRILRSIDKLHGNLTILIITHRISTITNADLIYRIEKGIVKRQK